MNVDAETSRLLGWDAIRADLARRARTPLGVQACLELAPSIDPEAIAQAQQRHRHLGLLADQGKRLPMADIEDLEDDLVRAGKGGTLDAEAIGRVARAMIVSTEVRTFLMTAGHQAGQALTDLARGSHDLGSIGRDLAGAFDATFSISLKSEWDLAAGALIAEEAGALMTNHKGGPLRFNHPEAKGDNFICAGPALHKAILERVDFIPDARIRGGGA